MTIRPGQQLVSLGPHVSGQVMAHPAQRANFGRVAELIERLRALGSSLPTFTSSSVCCSVSPMRPKSVAGSAPG